MYICMYIYIYIYLLHAQFKFQISAKPYMMTAGITHSFLTKQVDA